jgi:hypothetical protein
MRGTIMLVWNSGNASINVQQIPSFNGNYADFREILSALGFSGNIFYFSSAVQGASPPEYTWQFRAVAVDFRRRIICMIWINGTSDPTPSTFSADFANAIQLSSLTFNISFSSDKLIITTENYSDFKLLASVFNFDGKVFYSMGQTAGTPLPGQGGPAGYTFAVQAIDLWTKALFTLSLEGTSDPTPSSFLTDFPGAIAWSGLSNGFGFE